MSHVDIVPENKREYKNLNNKHVSVTNASATKINITKVPYMNGQIMN